MRNYLAALILLSLFACNNDDDSEGPSIPERISFTTLVDLPDIGLDQAPGFLGDADNANLFIASRQSNPETGVNAEKVAKYDLSGNLINEIYFDQLDFVTKNLHIIGNRLWVVGGTFINTYDLDLTSAPETSTHGFGITRFGSALYQDEVYVWGGDPNETFSDRIYKWDNDVEAFFEVAQLPSAKTWAHGEVFDDRIYMFGGQPEFQGTQPEDIIYVYDIGDTAVATLNLPRPVSRTFTTTHNNLIYVAGQETDTDPETEDLDIFFGVYDPESFTFTEIETNLSDQGFATVFQMTSVGDKLYVIYGEINRLTGQGFKIMEADL